MPSKTKPYVPTSKQKNILQRLKRGAEEMRNFEEFVKLIGSGDFHRGRVRLMATIKDMGWDKT